MIPTKIHGVLDYTVAILLIAMPWILGVNGYNAQTYVPVVLGIATIAYSFITSYECGAVPVISMQTHLILDTINGLILATSPWVFGFADEIMIPYVGGGVLELLVVALSNRHPQFKPRREFYTRRFSGKEQ
jgi:hypothetical protein